jgi:hypothetical protein
MTLKAYIWGMRLIGLMSLAAVAAVIFYIDPESSGFLGLALFYLVAFFALSSIFNLVLLFIRRKLIGNGVAASSIGLSFRQGMLMALMALGILALQNLGILVWWDALLVAGGVFLIELYFLSKD